MAFLKSVIIAFAILITMPSLANSDVQGMVQIPGGKSLYVHWLKAEKDRPTAVLVNGLTYSTKQWQRFARELHRSGVGVLMFDMIGMGETMKSRPYPTDVIRYEDQVDDLMSLTQTLGLTEKLNLVGLSYGGGISLAFASKFPDRIQNLIVMAPFTEAVQQQDLTIKSQIALTRILYPFNPATDDELYDFFLKQSVYTTYPSAEPIVLEHPFKLEATFRMVQGIRKFKAATIAERLPAGSLHLLIAGNDQYIPRAVMEDFWNAVPQNSRASQIILFQSEHKIPEAIPRFSANLVTEILSQNPALQKGDRLLANPWTGRVFSDQSEFYIGREF